MRLRDYIIRRLLLLIPVLVGISLLTFTLSHMVGDPVAAYLPLSVAEKVQPEQIERIVKAHGLDQPVYVQYAVYVRDLLQGDWGISRSDSNRPVVESISRYFPATFELAIVAIVISVALGIPLGIVSATRKDRPVDHTTRIFALGGVSTPIFWLGLMMQYLFFYSLKTRGLPSLPLAGRADQFMLLSHPEVGSITGMYLIDSLLTGNIRILLSAMTHIIMPAFALSYITLAIITRLMRSSMLEVLRQDYITLAKSKGLSERVVIYRHALRNALLPTVTVTGLAFGGLLEGAPITETVFSWPGVGRWAVFALQTDDIAAIMGFTILAAIIYTLANLIVDIVYSVIDPRIRLG